MILLHARGTIHHWTVIKAFAEEFLGIPAILNPTDINHKPQDDELAETVEALNWGHYSSQ